MKKPQTFVIAGSGWRALFYVRIARRYPQLFRLGAMLCRSEEKAEQMRRREQIPAVTTMKECEACRPDFVVVAVNREVICETVRTWAEKGYAVLAETPAGADQEQLKELWELQQKGARIQVAEQYHRYPFLAAGLAAVEQGRLGEPYAVTLSVAHDYHGASLIRRMLRILPEPVTLRGERYFFPVQETDSRYGAVTDGSVKERERVRVTMEFASGKAAFYDFSGVQYHSFIRARHLNVQGQDGEWNDRTLRYAGENHEPVCEPVRFRPQVQHLELWTPELQKLAEQWDGRDGIPMENWQDEYAIATMMYDMGRYLETGEEVYPLAEALEDAGIWLMIQEAAAHPGKVIASAPVPWRQ